MKQWRNKTHIKNWKYENPSSIKTQKISTKYWNCNKVMGSQFFFYAVFLYIYRNDSWKEPNTIKLNTLKFKAAYLQKQAIKTVRKKTKHEGTQYSDPLKQNTYHKTLPHIQTKCRVWAQKRVLFLSCLLSGVGKMGLKIEKKRGH